MATESPHACFLLFLHGWISEEDIILLTEMKKSKVNIAKLLNYSFFVICLLAYSVLMLSLFYKQTCSHNGEWFQSDMEAYLLTMLGQESGFDFPYPVYFTVGKFFLLFTDVEWAGALATMLLNSLSPIVLAYYLHKSLQKYYDKLACKEWMGILTTVITFSVFFISMLFAPEGVYLPGMTHKYLGVFSPNPYHNATYMATRPFTIVTFFLFARILDYYEERTDLKEFAWFGFFLLLSTMTKPSFTLVFVSAAGLLMAFRIIAKKWKNFMPSVKLGLTFIPTFIALLYQFGGVFGGSSQAGPDGGIGFGWASAWKVHMENIPFAIILASAFPFFMLVFRLKELKTNTLYRFSWFMYLVSLMELLVLFEKGDRFVHMNFSWGYMHGIFFIFITTLIVLLRDTICAIVEKRRNGVLLLPFWLAYGWHLICGIIYFLYIWSGQFYYCF